MQTLQPLFDRILVQRDEALEKSGNIYIAPSAKEPPNSGIVVAVGEGRLCPTLCDMTSMLRQGEGKNIDVVMSCHIEPLRVSKGDRILFQSYAGTEIMDAHTGKALLLMREDDVLAIIRGEPSPAPLVVESPSNDTLGDPNE